MIQNLSTNQLFCIIFKEANPGQRFQKVKCICHKIFGRTFLNFYNQLLFSYCTLYLIEFFLNFFLKYLEVFFILLI